jgi:ElaB/YqjD/DUF883 family membrane-anchored ribosome-binding protein
VSSHSDQLLSQLSKLVEDIEGLATSATHAGAEGAAGVSDRLKDALADAHTRLRNAEQGLKRGAVDTAKAADGYVRDHAWVSVGVAAAIAFLLGALSTRRD